MKFRNWLGYIIYSLILLVYIAGSFEFLDKVYKEGQASYNAHPYIIWSTLIFVMLGVILGFDYIIKEGERDGSWRINYIKLITITLPSLYYISGTCIVWFNIRWLIFTTIPLIREVQMNYMNFIYSTVCIILGYSIISSPYKKE